MIQWTVFVNNMDDGSRIDLSSGARVNLKETDSLVFSVTMDAEDLSIKGVPAIVIGDIPLIMVMEHEYKGEGYHFISDESIYSHRAKYFYNFFGESDVTLYFDNDFTDALSITFDILARKENAIVANDMLSFLTNNLEDAVAICFSRSKKGAHLRGEDGHNFNKIDAIEKTVSFLSESTYCFIRERKYISEDDMILSENGQPTGPNSVHWALTNLDMLSPASHDDVNIYFNNRAYHYDKLPKEILKNNYDVYENRVINSFLYISEQFLFKLKGQYQEKIPGDLSRENSEYVRFDHTMAQFSKMALEVKIKEIDTLILKLKGLRTVFLKLIPSKYVSLAPPRMTHYVSRKSHYREAFKLIEMCHRAQAPDFSSDNILLGLKNLAIIYELSSLVMLHNSIGSTFSIDDCIMNFRQHSDKAPFGGIDIERPKGFINNHFIFENDDFLIELFYEAKIYPYSANSRPGDLIDTSNTYSSAQYGRHHFCPDFIAKFKSKKWGVTFTAILDSKFKDLNTVKNYDIDTLTNKYLLNIHSVSSDGNIKISPVDILIVLFSHGQSGNIIRKVSPRHCLTGQYPAFPQSTAICLNPKEQSLLNEHLFSIKEIISMKNK